MKRRYLSLEDTNLAVDDRLVSRMPPGLAAYYLALPLASEDGSLSVAMAHPDNETALTVLGDLFAVPIVPVRVRTDTLHCLLRRLYKETPAPSAQILCWSAQEHHASMVAYLAARFAQSMPGAVTTFSSQEHRLEVVLDVMQGGNFDLAVIAPPPERSLATLSELSPTSLLLFRGKRRPLRQALVVLRGYASDGQMLERLSPLLERVTSVTLLPLLQAGDEESLRVVPQNGPQKRHLHRCLNHDVLDPANTLVRFRQGPAVRQVMEELQLKAYDLVAISAEGNGHFVSGVLAAIEEQGLQGDRAYFILKPPAPNAGSPAKGARQSKPGRDL